ncbi:putative GH3 auxin-responsive promoter [Lyophyllum shimeji]|uniref:GH3 auxin-responsive promoter n=1 Tax=Lyophyllum shimeji TaxID=47721 RepID=A0A9P3PH77_LYOSH|nr:putative GH3 auxin-responsive promoter [Lyophyllum shimeji]
MTLSQTVPAPIPTLPPKLVEQLKQRAADLLAYLISTNAGTAYFREAPLLSDLRAALGHVDECRSPDANDSLNTFIATVPLSTYEDYRPYVARFLESPRRLSAVSNLLAPGIPSFVLSSSGTTSGAAKYFLKYRHPPSTSSSSIHAFRAFFDASTEYGRHCTMFNLRYQDLLEVVDDDDANSQMVDTVPLCLGSSAAWRTFHGWKVENDSALMTIKAPNSTSPIAIAFINAHRTYLLMHALFALEDRSLEMINALFSTIFLDFLRLIDEHWDMLIQAIEDGVVPELDGAENVHQYLQAQFKPNPTRAAELRTVGNDTTSPGWAQRLWPDLRLVIANASGMFSRVTQQIRHYTGDSICFQSAGFGSSEAWVAEVYDPQRDLNLYKMSSDDLFEYLDVSLPETAAHLKRAWEVEIGKDYELVLTTRDGFWRYRIGDIVEIAGFDPVDGQPIIRYSGRRKFIMRAAGEFVTDKELLDAVHAVSDTLGNVTEFTVIIDDRRIPRAYGFLVELNGSPGPKAKDAPSRLNDFLRSTNDTFAYFSSRGGVGTPTIRVLAPGTFRSYREWRINNSALGGGQIKVPTITVDDQVVEWLLVRVVEEI